MGGWLLPIVGTRDHVLFVDEMDAVNGAPAEMRGKAPHHPSPATTPWAPSALLVPVENELGLFGDLPHAHSPIPAPGCHTGLPAQGIQGSHGVLVAKAAGQRRFGLTQGHEGSHGREGDHMGHAHPCPGALTVSPHRSSQPHSTPSRSGRGKCCRAGGCLCGTPAPKGTGRGSKPAWSPVGNRQGSGRRSKSHNTV